MENKEAILKGVFSVDPQNFLSKKQKAFILQVQKAITTADIELIFSIPYGYSAYMDTLNNNWSEDQEENKKKFIQFLFMDILIKKARAINSDKARSLDLFAVRCDNFKEISTLINIDCYE